jgi:hypothetical protein
MMLKKKRNSSRHVNARHHRGSKKNPIFGEALAGCLYLYLLRKKFKTDTHASRVSVSPWALTAAEKRCENREKKSVSLYFLVSQRALNRFRRR